MHKGHLFSLKHRRKLKRQTDEHGYKQVDSRLLLDKKYLLSLSSYIFSCKIYC